MLLRLFKKLDFHNSVRVPKSVVEKFGNEYYMEVYEDKIVLIPIKLEKKGN